LALDLITTNPKVHGLKFIDVNSGHIEVDDIDYININFGNEEFTNHENINIDLNPLSEDVISSHVSFFVGITCLDFSWSQSG